MVESLGVSKYIPEIDDTTLSQLCRFIQPVVRFGRHLYYIEPCSLRYQSFLSDPKLTRRARWLEPVGTFTTYHKFGYPGFFAPSVAEVLAQIPRGWLPGVHAFSVAGPQAAEDLNAQMDAIDKGVHRAVTTVYRRWPITGWFLERPFT